MKRFAYIYGCVTVAIFLLLTNDATAQQAETAQTDSSTVEISLLTCEPREKIYALYGHTAIRITDPAVGLDIAVNYGMFSFTKPYFIPRFVFGLTDYELGIDSFDDFLWTYGRQNCGVRQQTLNLTDSEKQAILAAILENYKPENRVYRYNYFYDNCTTRARDVLVHNLEGTINYADNSSNPSYREMIHAYTGQRRWARFGKDLLLGVKADMPTSLAQQQFLPDSLRKSFDYATVTRFDGSTSRLVGETTWVIPCDDGIKPERFPLTPRTCTLIFAAIIVALSIVEWCTRRIIWIVDAVLMLAFGLAGLVLFAMIFSEHPTVSLNFQILLLNPLSAVFLWSCIHQLRRSTMHWWLKIWAVLILLFLILGLFQDYAEGMRIVALSLLYRYVIVFFITKKTTPHPIPIKNRHNE